MFALKLEIVFRLIRCKGQKVVPFVNFIMGPKWQGGTCRSVEDEVSSPASDEIDKAASRRPIQDTFGTLCILR